MSPWLGSQMYDEPLAADLLRSTRAETRAFGISLGMDGKTRRGRRQTQLSLPLEMRAGPRRSLEACAMGRLKSPLLFIYVPRCSRHVGRKFYTIAVRPQTARALFLNFSNWKVQVNRCKVSKLQSSPVTVSARKWFQKASAFSKPRGTALISHLPGVSLTGVAKNI